MIKQKIKAIAFDIGGVMAKEDNFKTHYLPLCKSLKIDEKKFFELRKKYIPKASKGRISARTMIYSFARELKIDKEKFLKYWIKYKRGSIKKNIVLEKYIKKMKNLGYKVVSMSGVLDLHYKLCKEKEIYDVFDFNICSFKVGSNKPEMKIYKLLLKRLRLSPNEIVFIDDTKDCLIPAKKLGIKTILFKNNKQLIKDLNRLGVDIKCQ